MNKPALTIQQAVNQLCVSPRGRKALTYFHALLVDGGCYLDLHNLNALEALVANCAHITPANVRQDIEDELATWTALDRVECKLLVPGGTRSIPIRTVPAC